MKNNNREVVALLAKKEFCSKKGRNFILIGAVAFAVAALFCVFSLAVGKIETDCLLYMRSNGTAANTTLERATEEQCGQIKKLSYIKSVGKYVYFGETSLFACAVLDTEAWEEMQKPAFTDINGTYPAEKDEVMLPVGALEEMGIQEPEIGMEIPLSIEFEHGTEEDLTFRLSGYYTEYADPAAGAPNGYFSEKYLETISGSEEFSMTLLLKQDDWITGIEAEERLYEDVAMRDDSQQFIGANTMTWEAVYSITGGFRSAFVFTVVLLLSAGLLIYNVLYISLSRDIREYGLLKTLGTTKRQLQGIVFRQIGVIILWGCVIGMASGILIVLTLIPWLLSNMYLQGFGNASRMIAFHPVLLVLAVLFGGAVTFLSSVFAINCGASLTPIESMKYMEKVTGRGRKKRTGSGRKSRKEGMELTKMAWRNVLRFKKPFLVTVISLMLGIIVSLAAVVIVKGTDTTNKINEENADFKIMSGVSALNCEEYTGELFPAALREKLQNLRGVQSSSVTSGGFGKVSLQEDALKLRLEDFGVDKGFAPFVVHKLSDEYLVELKKFADEKGLFLDMDKVISGEGVILLHYHLLSKIEKEQSKNTVGVPISIYGLDEEKTQDMTFCGYLDIKEKGLPDLATTWNGPVIIYLLASETGFQRMGLTEQAFVMELTADSELEPVTKEEVKKLVNQFNQQYAPKNQMEEMRSSQTLGIDIKSDDLESAKGYIDSVRLVMGAVCVILICMGLVNYVNVTITSLVMRKKELAVMESIGAATAQLKKMLLLEGIFYSLFIIVFTAVFGSGVLYVLGKMMKEQIRYFVFHYPVAEFAICAVLLFAACILIPLLVYRRFFSSELVFRNVH